MIDCRKEYEKWKEFLLDIFDDKVEISYKKNIKNTVIKGMDYSLVCTNNKFSVNNYGVVFYKGKINSMQLVEYAILRIRILKNLIKLYENPNKQDGKD